MSEDEALRYVQASAAALGLSLDEARAQRVAAHLQRTATMAQWLDAVPLAPEDEVAEIFRPAPFLTVPNRRRQP